MTPEAQRIAIAEACPNLFIVSTGTFSDNVLYWNDEGMCGPAVNPLIDLNAMHEAEKVLKGNNRLFALLLRNIVTKSKLDRDDQAFDLDDVYAIAHSAADQRAEAFLRTLNLWDDSK